MITVYIHFKELTFKFRQCFWRNWSNSPQIMENVSIQAGNHLSSGLGHEPSSDTKLFDFCSKSSLCMQPDCRHTADWLQPTCRKVKNEHSQFQGEDERESVFGGSKQGS